MDAGPAPPRLEAVPLQVPPGSNEAVMGEQRPPAAGARWGREAGLPVVVVAVIGRGLSPVDGEGGDQPRPKPSGYGPIRFTPCSETLGCPITPSASFRFGTGGVVA